MEERLEALLGRKRSAERGSVRVGGLYGAASGFLLASLIARGTSLLVVTPDAKAANALRLDLDTLSGRSALPFPAWPRVEADAPPDVDVLMARTAVLVALREARRGDGGPVCVVASLDALLQAVPSPDVLDAAALRLAKGDERSHPALLEHLAGAGYGRVGAVESPGEFAARGGLLDVWPWGAGRPVRLDFFGDEIESIRDLDPATQRSGDERDDVEVLTLQPERFRDPHVEEGAAFLTGHLPAASRAALVERAALIGVATSLRGGDANARSRVAKLESALAGAAPFEISALPLGDEGDLDVDVGSVDALRGIALRAAGEDSSPADRAVRIAHAFTGLTSRADRVVVYRRAKGEEERLDELFEEHAPDLDVTYRSGSLTRSFLWSPSRTAHVAYDDLADLPQHERKRDVAVTRSRPIENFLELEEGGLVVHLHHGIGIFRGLDEIEGPDGLGEFLKIEFAEGTVVYVPVARIDMVQRYVGSGRTPRLSKVGGVEWTNRKKRVSKAVAQLAEDLLETQAARQIRMGPPLPEDSDWQREFEEAFPHQDTPDQTAACKAIKRDLESDHPMDRLLCGDVGYGKTEVALRAIFKVITSGKQAAVLVPTKILAEQHARVFAQRLAPYPLRVRVLSGLKTAGENRETVEGLKDGTIDLCVGTHRLLSKDVGFKNLGLLIVDEEQRFGVKHKERLKSLRAEVDILSLSATPIPRTLHMALLGIRDISNLTTPPLGRHPIDTAVAREEDGVVREAIERELARGGQMFMVTSRIREIPVIAAWLARLVPEIRVTYIHGRMEKHTVERRMLRFVRGEVDLLLATTIIESGLDIPNANTIIIRDADRYGLAELHQLRGRVGRERRRAHALILLPRDRTVRSEANERLRAIEEYSELGAGFRIAMRDLEIRGAGNLLGPQQSGHIASVGYDLYCKLLADAVRKAQGDGDVEPAQLAYLGIDLPGAVPDDYVGDTREKFRLFRRVAATETRADLDDLELELLDRFGPVPAPLGRLLLAQRARIVAGGWGIARLGPAPADTPGVELFAPAPVIAVIEASGIALRRLDTGSAFFPAPEATGVEAPLRQLIEALEKAGA